MKYKSKIGFHDLGTHMPVCWLKWAFPHWRLRNGWDMNPWRPHWIPIPTFTLTRISSWRTGSISSGGQCRRKRNSLELSAALCYPLTKEGRLLQQTPFRSPTPKVEFPEVVSYLSVRGAHPGCNRVGIIFFACSPCLCWERQATL